MKKPHLFRRLLRPEVILSLLVIIFMIAAAFPSKVSDAIDIHLHDTYFLISRQLIYILLAGSFGYTAYIYFITRNFRQWHALQIFHILCICGFYFLPNTDYNSWASYQSPWRVDYKFWLFLLGNLAFLINLTAGFIRGKKTVTPAQ